MKKIALITGASSGIGKELAYIHAEHGGDMVLVARRLEKLKEIKKNIEEKFSSRVYLIQKDLSLENAAREIFDELEKEKISPDYLINNAGFGGQGTFSDRNWEIDRAMMQVNMIAPSQLCKLFIPKLLEKGSGKIMNVSSTASFMLGPNQAVYFASKSYMQFLSNALWSELEDTGVSVTNLMPGATATEFAEQSGMDKTGLFEKTVSAKSVAQDGYKGMLEGKIDVVSGLSFRQKIMMKMIPFTPKKIILKQIKEMQRRK